MLVRNDTYLEDDNGGLQQLLPNIEGVLVDTNVA
jgi:hypothetical protein